MEQLKMIILQAVEAVISLVQGQPGRFSKTLSKPNQTKTKQNKKPDHCKQIFFPGGRASIFFFFFPEVRNVFIAIHCR
jgi:hypothetical protein